MKKYKNIDELFKEELNDYSLEPSKDRWKKIESNLFNRFTKGWWIALIILLLVSIPIIFHTYYGNNIKATSNFNPVDSVITMVDSIKYDSNYIIAHQETVKLISSEPKSNNKGNEVIISENIRKNEAEIDLTFGMNIYNDNISNEYKYNNQSIEEIEYRSLYSLNNNNSNLLYEEYPNSIVSNINNKKNKLRIYTSFSGYVGVLYYQDSPDLLTWSSDFGIGYMTNKFYFETGLGYQKAKQNGELRFEYETSDSVGYYNEVISFQINPNNTNEVSYNTKIKNVYDSVIHYSLDNPIYTYDYINIPIIIGYTITRTEKVNLSIQGGLIFSFLTKTYIPVINFDVSDATLLKVTNNTYARANNYTSIHLAIRSSYKLYGSVSLLLQPEFSKSISSISKANGVRRLPYSFGVRGGILFNF